MSTHVDVNIQCPQDLFFFKAFLANSTHETSLGVNISGGTGAWHVLVQTSDLAQPVQQLEFLSGIGERNGAGLSVMVHEKPPYAAKNPGTL